jgi:hypothetical protein
MPLDPIIAQGVTPIGADIPNTLMRLQAIRGMQQENQLRGIQTQVAQNELGSQQGVKRVLQNPDATLADYAAAGGLHGVQAYGMVQDARMHEMNVQRMQTYYGLTALHNAFLAAKDDPQNAHAILETVRQYAPLIGGDPNKDLSQIPPDQLAQNIAIVEPKLKAARDSLVPPEKQAEIDAQFGLKAMGEQGENLRTAARIKAEDARAAAQRGSEAGLQAQRLNVEIGLKQKELEIQGAQNYQTRAGKLRDDYTKTLNDLKIPETQTAYQRLTAAVSDPSGASDLALMASYMKLIDPSMTLRPGMLANAENSGSVPQKVQARYNRIVNGERMSASERAEYVAAGSKVYSQTARQVNAIQKDYTDKAQRANVKPEDVLTNTGAPAAPGEIGQGPGRSPAGGYQPGQTFQHASGATVQILPNQ